MSIEGYFNGINASQVFSSIIVNQSIDTQLDKGHFENLIIEGDLKIDSGLVNDVDIVSLNSTALRLDRDQLIEGTMVFAEVRLFRNLCPEFKLTRYVCRVSRLRNISKSGPSTVFSSKNSLFVAVTWMKS